MKATIKIIKESGGDPSERTPDTYIAYGIFYNDREVCTALTTYKKLSYWCDHLNIEHCETLAELKKEIRSKLKNGPPKKETNEEIYKRLTAQGY
jgi:hypothetical protein